MIPSGFSPFSLSCATTAGGGPVAAASCRLFWMFAQKRGHSGWSFCENHLSLPPKSCFFFPVPVSHTTTTVSGERGQVGKAQEKYTSIPSPYPPWLCAATNRDGLVHLVMGWKGVLAVWICKWSTRVLYPGKWPSRREPAVEYPQVGYEVDPTGLVQLRKVGVVPGRDLVLPRKVIRVSSSGRPPSRKATGRGTGSRLERPRRLTTAEGTGQLKRPSRLATCRGSRPGPGWNGQAGGGTNLTKN